MTRKIETAAIVETAPATLDDYFDEYQADVVAPRETAIAAARAEYDAARAAIDAALATRLAELGIVAPAPIAADRKPRSRIFANAAKITIISENHGLRPGAVNLAKFQILKQAPTVRDAHRLGVDNGYLRFYVERGLVAING